MEREELEAMLGRGMSLEQIGEAVGRHASTVAYWVEKYGLRAANRDRHLARGALDREALEDCVEEGLSLAEMAEQFGRSKGTVRHWLRRWGLQTAKARRREFLKTSAKTGETRFVAVCKRHGRTAFVREGNGYLRCTKCRQERVSQRRRRVKDLLVAEAGGKCLVCGYARNNKALQFHHLDPAAKRFNINVQGVTLSIDTLREEARKCVLLCSNCHVEVEDGAVDLPLEFAAKEKAGLGSPSSPK